MLKVKEQTILRFVDTLTVSEWGECGFVCVPMHVCVGVGICCP